MVENKFLDGVKLGLGFILVLTVFGLVGAAGLHYADEIMSGTFSGDFVFNGTLDLGNQASYNGVELDSRYMQGIYENSLTSQMIEDGTIQALDVNSTQIQLRISDICGNNSFVSQIYDNGSIVCTSIDGTIVDGIDWSELSNIPIGFADGIDNVDDADNSVTNELQTLGTSGNTITLTNGGSVTAPYATSSGNSDTVDGLHVATGVNNVANQIVRTDSSGYIQAGWINTASGSTTSAPTRIYGSYDDYIRYYTPANFATVMAGYQQKRVSGTCAVGSSIRAINSDGTVVCETDDVGILSESDPQVGTLTSGKWCTSDGSKVNCASNAPSSGCPTGSSPIGFTNVFMCVKDGVILTTGSAQMKFETNNIYIRVSGLCSTAWTTATWSECSYSSSYYYAAKNVGGTLEYWYKNVYNGYVWTKSTSTSLI